MAGSSRPSSEPLFWDVRYEREDHLFGTAPTAFVQREADRLAEGSRVVELGAGEGRTLAWLAAQRGCRATAVDFSREALRTAQRWAEERDLPLEAVQADVRTWRPERRWDAAIVTFLQLLPSERPALYRLLRRLVRPRGLILGEWFRPAHLSEPFDRMGPSRPDRMVPVEEVREAFEGDRIVRCEAADVDLEEGPLLNGRAAVVRVVVRRSRAGSQS